MAERNSCFFWSMWILVDGDGDGVEEGAGAGAGEVVDGGWRAMLAYVALC